jgi:hypothetical protein
MTCDECCQDNPVQPYTFRYGKKVGSKTVVGGRQVQYRVDGQKTVYLCASCLQKERRKELIKGGIILAIAAILIIVTSPLNTTAANEIWDFTGIAGALIGLYGAAVLFGALQGNTHNLGIQRAISLHKTDLVKQGYDRFLWD